MKTRTAIVSIVAALLAATGCNGSKSGIDAAALLETRCGVCHSIDIPKNARKSKSAWDETVSRMIAKGAKLSSEEKSALVNHLAKIYKH